MFSLLAAALLAFDLPPDGMGEASACPPTVGECVVCQGPRSNPWMKYGSLGLSAAIIGFWLIHVRRQPAIEA